MTNWRRGTVSVIALLGVIFCLGCSRSAEDCDYTASCDSPASGKGDAGTGGAASCSPACRGTTPVCNSSTKRCVECTKTSDCALTGRLICDTTTDRCIQCRQSSDCTNPAAAACIAGACVGCSADTDCSHITGRTVCRAAADAGAASGTCVQCTASNQTACTNNSCNATTNVCRTTRPGG
jgi:hypothetical protein